MAFCLQCCFLCESKSCSDVCSKASRKPSHSRQEGSKGSPGTVDFLYCMSSGQVSAGRHWVPFTRVQTRRKSRKSARSNRGLGMGRWAEGDFCERGAVQEVRPLQLRSGSAVRTPFLRFRAFDVLETSFGVDPSRSRHTHTPNPE